MWAVVTVTAWSIGITGGFFAYHVAEWTGIALSMPVVLVVNWLVCRQITRWWIIARTGQDPAGQEWPW